jgi:rubrerythrin
MSNGGEFDFKEMTKRIKRATAQPDGAHVQSPAVARALEVVSLDATADAVGELVSAGIPAPPPGGPDAPSPVEVIKDALRGAVQLEFATIPLYLTALWSIIDQAHPVAKSIRAVAHEEMLHLSLLCNLLSALGERPILTGSVVPRFPTRLPGGVHKELELRLEGYGPSALRTFMEIERPEKPIPIFDDPEETFPEEDTTIGEFYEALLEGFRKLDLAFDPKRQIAGPFTWFVMTNVEQVEKAISLIMAQGEGARGVPYTRYPRYLSHYYRFKSLAMLTELHWDEQAKKLRKGAPIPPPSVFTLAPASPDGYGAAAPGALRAANDRFEESFSQMLRLLEGSWLEGGDKSFLRALELMFDLGSHAQAMMRIGTPDGRGYCPCFRYRA